MESFEAFKITEKVCEARSGERMLTPVGASFWTERSTRPTLASWVACLATFPADWLDLWERASLRDTCEPTARGVYLMQ